MWKFRYFTQKEPVALEGRYVDVGNLKIQVRNAIAEGGFSTVYMALDAVSASKQYALKHMICNDKESLELALKEINVMKLLKGHPNVVTLCGHAILDKGRTKEALVVMEFCEKSLVSVLDSRGRVYFDEKQALSIFRDVCNAVYAMHFQSPPIAHRDLKAENLLLGPDGLWKLCDFGSTSTNHKRFEKHEEMGIEEDNIRKYTTPAYRAPEMWDLFRRDPISEKVDIWALGCLLFRICYFKNAFDGESKLQVLNVNYRIPDLPKYSTAVTNLITDMLQASPVDRPDILQKSLPDGPIEMQSTGEHRGTFRPANRSYPLPHRSPPPPPSSGGGGGQIGAFWSSQYANDCFIEENKPKFDDKSNYSRSRHNRSRAANHTSSKNPSPAKDEITPASAIRRSVHGSHDGISKDFEISFLQKDIGPEIEKPTASSTESSSLFKDELYGSFVATFDNEKLNSGVNNNTLIKEEELKAEIRKLKDHLKQANLEKAEITSKYEKLSAICRFQRQEIQELKQAIAVRTPSPNNYKASRTVQPSTSILQGDANWKSSDPKLWLAFADEPQSDQLPPSKDHSPPCVGKNTEQSSQTEFDSWSFGVDSFRASPAAGTVTSNEGNSSEHLAVAKTMERNAAIQPAGWAGF